MKKNDESYVDSDEIEEMPDEAGSDLLELLEHMQRQLTFLEKKLDIILSRTETARSFDGERSASKPFRKSFDSRKPFDSRKHFDRAPQRFDRAPRRDRNNDDDRERGFRDNDFSRSQYPDRRKGGRKPGGKPRPSFGKKPFHSRFSE